MAKKQKRVEDKRIPTKRQLSKWQRQRRTRRIIMIAASIFLAGVVGYVGYGYYNKEIKPSREVVIEVNDVSFNMGYYVKMLAAQTRDMESAYLYYMTGQIAGYIEDAEVMKQGANDLGIVVAPQKIDEEIKKNELPGDRVYRDVIGVSLLRERLMEYFDSQLPDEMEQAHIEVMLVESRNVADSVTAAIQSSGNFTALANDFSCNSNVQGDLGWLPEELMPSPLIWDVASSLEPGSVSQPIHDDLATKDVGYWLIEVTDKNEEKGIKARAILLGSKQEADEVKAELDDENFAELADKYSQYKGEEDGGELGWLKQEDIHSAAFDKVAFNLDLNVVSEPVQDKAVQTKGGYWIVKVLGQGEHEISEEVKEKVASNDFAEWFQVQRENSVINNYLDEEKIAWAVDEVLKER